MAHRVQEHLDTTTRRNAGLVVHVQSEAPQGTTPSMLHLHHGEVRTHGVEDDVDAAQGTDLHLVLCMSCSTIPFFGERLGVRDDGGTIRPHPIGSVMVAEMEAFFHDRRLSAVIAHVIVVVSLISIVKLFSVMLFCG